MNVTIANVTYTVYTADDVYTLMAFLRILGAWTIVDRADAIRRIRASRVEHEDAVNR